MKALGVGMIKRNVMKNASPSMEIHPLRLSDGRPDLFMVSHLPLGNKKEGKIYLDGLPYEHKVWIACIVVYVLYCIQIYIYLYILFIAVYLWRLFRCICIFYLLSYIYAVYSDMYIYLFIVLYLLYYDARHIFIVLYSDIHYARRIFICCIQIYIYLYILFIAIYLFYLFRYIFIYLF